MQYESVHQTNSTTLEEVREHFQQWRSKKPAHNSHIPDYLWDQVAQIVEHYRQSDILKYLKINKNQLVTAMESRKNHHHMGSIIPSTSQLTPDNITIDPFIKISMPMTFDSQSISQQPIPIAPTTSTQQTNHPKIELVHPNGITMRITDITDHQLSDLLFSFMGVS